MKKGFTLIEIILTIAIAGILIIGSSQVLKTLSTSALRAKEVSNLSLDTQSAINQISSLLYYRVPNSVIGYDGNTNFKPIESIESQHTILEWFGTFHEATTKGYVSNFIDMAASDYATKILKSPNSNFTQAQNLLNNKFLIANTLRDTALFFSGSFDMGNLDITKIGWHGSVRTDIYNIDMASNDTLMLIGTQPKFIYEKYFIADTAYALARGEDISKNAKCVKDLKIPASQIDNALFLFYGFRPWKNQTFCADKGSQGVKHGKATLLSLNIKGLHVRYENYTIRVDLDASKNIKGTQNKIHITKQKAIF